MISCYFGVPGAGKTTLLTRFAVKELKKIKSKVRKSKYDKVYTNFECKGCYKMNFGDLERYKFENCLILLDELMLDADNRGFKQFPIGIRDFLTLHRHVGVDIIYATQAYDKVDAKIRALTFDLWYMTKSVIPLISELTFCKRIYRRIVISEYNGDLIMGYRFCNFLEMLFTTNIRIVFRRRFYKYFNSFDECQLAFRPVYKGRLWAEPYSRKKDIIQKLERLEKGIFEYVDKAKRHLPDKVQDKIEESKEEKDSRTF